MKDEKKHTNQEQFIKKAYINLQDEPFVGLWENHEALADSETWVRKTRQQEWKEKPIDGRGDTGG